MADSSSPVSAFSARCDRNSTIAATISASAPNRPSSALTKTCGCCPSNASEPTPANATTRLTRIGQAVVAFQRAGEQLEQSPADQDADGHAGDQRRGRLDQRAAAHLRPELLAGQHRKATAATWNGEPDDLAGFLASTSRRR